MVLEIFLWGSLISPAIYITEFHPVYAYDTHTKLTAKLELSKIEPSQGLGILDIDWWLSAEVKKPKIIKIKIKPTLIAVEPIWKEVPHRMLFM